MMHITDFVSAIRNIADNYNTLYVMGGIGSPLNTTQAERLISHDSYNRRDDRKAAIQAAVRQGDVWAFDCAGIIKAVLWGWYGNRELGYGGAKYASNDVPDHGANTIISECLDVSTDFSDIRPGEAVWMKDHIGIYVGGGLAVECTPIWADGVQYTACNCDVHGYKRRDWTKRGKLPWVDYAPKAEPAPEPVLPASGFWDVPDTHWAADYVRKCATLGIINGDGNGNFRPDAPLTRAEMSAVAWRIMAYVTAPCEPATTDPALIDTP